MCVPKKLKRRIKSPFPIEYRVHRHKNIRWYPKMMNSENAIRVARQVSVTKQSPNFSLEYKKKFNYLFNCLKNSNSIVYSYKNFLLNNLKKSAK